MRFLQYLAFLLLLSANASGRLVFETTQKSQTADLGDAVLTAAFPFENTGSEPVRILQLRSSCGCTAAAADEVLIDPGEKSAVKVEFTIGNRTGVRTNRIAVQTDRGQTVELQFVVTLPRAVSISPRILRWQVDENPKAKVATITLHPEAAVEFGKITSSPGFEAELTEAETPRVFHLHITPASTEARQRGIVRIAFASDQSVSKSEKVDPLAVYVMIF
ncbi:MAG: DUF1573 domain-containing protein [Opitutales bacterium]